MAAVLEQKSATTPTIVMPSAELTRLLKIFAAKTGGGNSPFESIAIVRAGDEIRADYKTQSSEIGIVAHFPSPTGDENTGSIATNDPGRLIDYIDGGLFAPDAPITLSQEEETIRIHGGRKNVTMRGFNPSLVPRTEFENPYGYAIGGFFVNSNPSHRPPNGSPWDQWTARGYAVVYIPTKALSAVLTAGSLIQKRYKAATISLTTTNTTLSARVQESQESNEDCVDIGELEGATVIAGSPNIDVGIRYSLADPVWSALALTKSENVMMIHHPTEGRINFAVVENGLAVTFVVARTAKDSDTAQ